MPTAEERLKLLAYCLSHVVHDSAPVADCYTVCCWLEGTGKSQMHFSTANLGPLLLDVLTGTTASAPLKYAAIN